MASSSIFSTCTIKRSVLAPKASKTNAESVCNHLNGIFKLTYRSLSISASADTSHSWAFPNGKAFDWKQGNLSLMSAVKCRALNVETKPLFSLGSKFELEDVIEAQQFDRDTLSAIFDVALEMEKIEKNSTGSNLLQGYLMATLFYEPSTRTRLSFESAMKRLGGEVLTTENAREFSSAAKGETLEDTIRTVEGYTDIIVMRHFESGAARRAAATANIPVINAGDGPGQHPTQALLDVYTIQREIGKLDGIKVGLVGDLAYGRTVRSLAYLLAKYKDVKVYFVSPEVVKMKDDIKDYLTSKGVEWEESADLMEVASKCDVVYQTRIQRERFGERIDLYEEARGKYIVDQNVLDVMQKHAVVMHPLPRLDEITVEVDADPRAAYFRQAKNGLYIQYIRGLAPHQVQPHRHVLESTLSVECSSRYPLSLSLNLFGIFW
ncbi:aspartate carbamoyltransferase 1, chloroplastic-like isoform X1 [Salvia miltiorrhiza]|uniref:aspartate carbamoyltransferase 1, chloroplastic-like isoform X1 n=1 Tax=Salvia miltiorrhiza TaxID=226208 RepID=UPI0025ABC2F5|nr:aspartate carbamoyltransferase 1, chloroplastic-like isoform X1 [Salvia miltiorrhiza]